jgi:hypothetical protein
MNLLFVLVLVLDLNSRMRASALLHTLLELFLPVLRNGKRNDCHCDPLLRTMRSII